MSDRLSTADPLLAERLHSAESTLRLRVAELAVRVAVSASQLDRDHRYLALVPGDSPALVALAEQLDNEYFDLQDKLDLGQSAEPSVENAFGKARSASSLVFLSNGDTSEAVYEALSAIPDPAGILSVIEQALTKGT